MTKYESSTIMPKHNKHFIPPIKHPIHHITKYTTTALALTLSLTLLNSTSIAGNHTSDIDTAWKSTTNHNPTTIQDFGSITTQSKNPTRPFRLRARAGVWFAAPSGDFHFGYNPTPISLEHHLNLNDPNPSFTGDITIDFPGQDDHWLLWFDVFNTSQNATASLPTAVRANGSIIPAGTTTKSSFASTSFGAHVGYDFFDNLLADKKSINTTEPSPDADLRVHAIAGLRALHIDQSFRALTTGVKGSYEDWHTVAEAGARLSIILNPAQKSRGNLDISLTMTGGYGLTNGNLKTFDLFTAITWLPTNNLGFTAGYRLFHINIDNVSQSNGKPFVYQGNQSGFFLGGQLQF